MLGLSIISQTIMNLQEKISWSKISRGNVETSDDDF